MLFLAEIQEVAPKIVVDSYLREKENLPRERPTMEKILRIGKGVKVRSARVDEICDLTLEAKEIEGQKAAKVA